MKGIKETEKMSNKLEDCQKNIKVIYNDYDGYKSYKQIHDRDYKKQIWEFKLEFQTKKDQKWPSIPLPFAIITGVIKDLLQDNGFFENADKLSLSDLNENIDYLKRQLTLIKYNIAVRRI